MTKKKNSNKSSQSNVNEQGPTRNRTSDKKLLRNQGQTRIRTKDSGDSNKSKGGDKNGKK